MCNMSIITKQRIFSENVLSNLNNSAMIQLQKQKRKNKDTKDKIFEVNRKKLKRGGKVHWDIKNQISI